jgi:hypothetical protein
LQTPQHFDRNILHETIAVYAQNTPKHLETNTNSLVHWFEDTSIHPNHNKYYYCSFLFGKKTIGFLMVTVIKEYILYIDQVALSKNYRTPAAFCTLMEISQSLLLSRHPTVQYVVDEVAREDFSRSNAINGISLIDIEKPLGFRCSAAAHWIPSHQQRDFGAGIEGVLMIRPIEDTKRIFKRTYLDIVDDIFFGHYLPWKIQYIEDNEAPNYKQHLKDITQRIHDSIADEEVQINGGTPFSSTTPSISYSDRHFPLRFFILFLIMTILIGGMLYFLQSGLSIEDMFGAVVCAVVVTVLSYVMAARDRETLKDIIKYFKHFKPF